jgi:hypothetical protein
MDYLGKYLKYKKKYVDLKTTADIKSITNEINMIGGNPQYIQFTSVEDVSQKTDLIRQFKEELSNLSSVDKVCRNLLEIIQDKNLKLGLFVCPTSDYYLIIISCHQDKILIRLGNEYGFPRGFPIIWQPGKVLNMYGFYPKFNNDSIKEDEFNRSELDNSIEINFNFKYSGFLGQVVPFTIAGRNYWTTCGKNSTNYKFSHIVRDLVSAQITTELLNKLCTEKIHFCGETISKFDQSHGAKVNREGLVTTMVAKGHWINMEKEFRIEGSINKFIETFDQNNMQTFCLENNLLIDCIFKVKTYNKLLEYMIGLNNRRNLILLPLFMNYWDEFQKKNLGETEFLKGNINHDDYLGNILEGIIIKLTVVKGGLTTYKTIKYKFPFYTSRTMLLREFLKNNETEIFETNILPTSFFDDNFMFVDRWVVNYENQKNYWRYILALFYNNFPSLNGEYKKYYDAHSDKNTIIASHIYLMDLHLQDPLVIYNKEIDYLTELIKILQKYLDPKKIETFDFSDGRQHVATSEQDKLVNSVPILLSFGPIGSGKTTVSTAIEEYNPDVFKHIDGDVLDLTVNQVLTLKDQRNDYTIYKVVEAICNKKVPVLSSGGGVLLNRSGGIAIFDYLNSIYYNRVTFIPTILLPFRYPAGDKTIITLEGDALNAFVAECDSQLLNSRNTSFPPGSIVGALYQLYYDEERFRETYDARNYNGEPTFRYLFDKNKANFEIILKIITSLGRNILKNIILFPLVTPEFPSIIAEQKILIFEKIKDIQIRNDIIPHFKQKRLLVNYESDILKFHHITIKYDNAGTIPYESIESDENKYLVNRDVVGIFHICPSTNIIEKLMNIRTIASEIKSKIYPQEMLPSSIKYADMIKNIDLLISTITSMLDNYNNIDKTKNFNIELGKTLSNILLISRKEQFTSDLVKKLEDMETKGVMRFDFKKNNWFVKFITFPGIFNGDLANKAHITVDPGVEKAAEMRSATQQIYDYKSGNKIIKLENGRYYFDNKNINIRSHFYSIYYI